MDMDIQSREERVADNVMLTDIYYIRLARTSLYYSLYRSV